jgi:hypothetical protein
MLRIDTDSITQALTENKQRLEAYFYPVLRRSAMPLWTLSSDNSLVLRNQWRACKMQ